MDLYGTDNNIGSVMQPDKIDRNKEKIWLNDYAPKAECEECNLFLICKGGGCPHKLNSGYVSFNEQCKKNKMRINNMMDLVIKQNYIHYQLGVD